MFCSKCGAENPDAARFCAKCGTNLTLAAEAPAAAPLDTMRGAAPGATAAVSPTGKTPWVAALLSFFICGLGQLYNTDVKKGIVMFVGAILGAFLTAGVATFFIWIWGMVDGWQVAAGKMKRWT
jgi:TM2 domain-containing membrane protein YozV